MTQRTHGQYKKLADYQAELAACVRCGACQATCPVYQQTGQESSVARGKLELAYQMLAGTLPLDAGTKTAFSQCLLCGACAKTCPNGVPGDTIIAAARRELRAQQGASPVGRGVAFGTANPERQAMLLSQARRFARLLFAKIPETSGLYLRFAPEALKGRLLPPLPEKSFLAQMPERLEGAPGRPTVAFFAGCAINFLYPEIGVATDKVLHHLGYTVFLPRGQGCCGMPALSTGNGELAATLAEANIRALAGANTVITACASCGATLGRFYREIPDGAAQALAAKTRDIHVFLAEEGRIADFAALPKQAKRLGVAWHDPCHLKNHGITAAPRALLQSLPNVEFSDQDGASRCCGLGGTFSVTQADLSQHIAAQKAADLADTAAKGAEAIATGCPGCLMQLADLIHKNKLKLQTLHSMTLAAQALE